MTAYELARKYYPALWPLERLDKLLAAGRLTPTEYGELVSEPDTGEGG